MCVLYRRFVLGFPSPLSSFFSFFFCFFFLIYFPPFPRRCVMLFVIHHTSIDGLVSVKIIHADCHRCGWSTTVFIALYKSQGESK